MTARDKLMQDAAETIERLAKRVRELESEIQKSKGAAPDRSGLRGAIADSTRRGLPNSFAVKGVDTAKLIDNAAKRGKKQ